MKLPESTLVHISTTSDYYASFDPVDLLSYNTEVMRKKQVNPCKEDGRYRRYSQDSMMKAYKLVRDTGIAVKKAARMFGVPQQTLRDRVAGRIDFEHFGKEKIFTIEEEEKLVDHVETMASLGYGLSNTTLKKLAGELSFELNKRTNNSPMSNNWLYGFLKRWQDRLKSLKPRSLESFRAKKTTPEAIQTYFANLKTVLEVNDLINKPQHIYNLDETGLQPNHRPANVIANPKLKPQAITSPRGATTTVIGCVNATGNSLPPYFVFKGKRWNEELMKGGSVGAKGAISETGWSNSKIFKKYLQEHFLPNVRPDGSKQPIMLLYDGHTSHKDPETIRWAREMGIILFVLPAHSSHLLQPLDVAIFGPFKNYYYAECSNFMYRNMGQVITKYNICTLACRAYLKALTPLNIQSAFRKTGIYPFQADVIRPESLYTCESFREEKPVEKVKAMKSGKEAVEKFLQSKEEELTANKSKHCRCQCSCKKRTTSNKPDAGGKEITSDDYITCITNYENSRNNNQIEISKPVSPKPSTSGQQVILASQSYPDHTEEYASDEESIIEEDLCCICKRMSPPRLNEYPDLKIVNWGKCDQCGHWVHLMFCSPVRVIRRHTEFKCPHCSQ